MRLDPNPRLTADPAGHPHEHGLAYVFPGQGSQYPGMGRELTRCGSAGRDLVATAEEVTGLPVTELMNRADGPTIADPAVAQLLVFVSSSVFLRELAAAGRRPAVVAGHSLGEYTALVAAGCLEWEPALRLVAERGRVMSAAAKRAAGTMAAIVGLPVETVQELCDQVVTLGGVAVIANLNSPRQAVVSGTNESVLEIVERARVAGALRARRLPVGGAYHSPLMQAAEERLAPLLEDLPLCRTEVPLVSSVTGSLVTDPEEYRRQLIRQITRPVLWRITAACLAAAGTHTCVEVGPGRVLTGLGREMLRDCRHLSVAQLLQQTDRQPAAAAPR